MSQVDPRDFGRLEAEVKALQVELTEMSRDLKDLLELANKGRGGFWVGMTIAASLGAFSTWFLETFLPMR